jgi:hypothetical protein
MIARCTLLCQKLRQFLNEWVVRPSKFQKAILRLDIDPIGPDVPHPIIVEASSLCRMAIAIFKIASRNTQRLIGFG